MSNHDTLIAVATYNERDNLPRLVELIFEHCPECDLLVIDDNSPDGTGDWCDEYAKGDSRLTCHHRPQKMGLGSAAKLGIQHAVEQEYEFLVNLDADLSHDPADIPRLLGRLRSSPEIDVVVGSRYIAGGKIVGWPWYRRLSSKAINWLARLGLGIPVHDCSGSFRGYRVNRLVLIVNQIESKSYSVYEELLWRLWQAHANVSEVPICFAERQTGRTKLGLRQAAVSVGSILRLIAQFRWRQLSGLRDSSSSASRHVELS